MKTWELQHRPRDADSAILVTLDAEGSRAAIDQLREAIPAEHLVLYVREI